MASVEGNNSIINYYPAAPNALPPDPRTQPQAEDYSKNRGWEVPLNVVNKYLFPSCTSRSDLARIRCVCYPYFCALQPVLNLIAIIDKIGQRTRVIPTFVWDFREEAKQIYTLRAGNTGLLQADQPLAFDSLKRALSEVTKVPAVSLSLTEESTVYHAFITTNHTGTFEAAKQFILKNIDSQEMLVDRNSFLQLLTDLVSANYVGAFDAATMAAMQHLERDDRWTIKCCLQLFRALVTAVMFRHLMLQQQLLYKTNLHRYDGNLYLYLQLLSLRAM